MKYLTFNITHNGHTFTVINKPSTSYCFYNITGKYKASLLFAKNTYAHLEYKNLKFYGTVIKRNIWEIDNGAKIIVRKSYGRYHFATNNPPPTLIDKPLTSPVQDTLKEEKSTASPENTIYLYNYLTSVLPELYAVIENKEEFQRQLCDYLQDVYSDLEDEEGNLCSLDEIVEYENYVDVGPDEDPIIESRTIGEDLVNECKEFFICFHQSEQDIKCRESIITLDNVIKRSSELRNLPRSYVQQEFEAYIEKNDVELSEPNILYNQTDELEHIGDLIWRTYSFSVFLDSLDEKINKIIADMNAPKSIIEEIHRFCANEYSVDYVPNEKEFKRDINYLIKTKSSFYALYDKFISLFGTDVINLEWTDENIQLFEKYDNEKLAVSPQHNADYEVYKHIITYFRRCFFKKNSTKLKPVIEKFPDFVSYASSVFDILFKHGILIDQENTVIYNENGDIDSAYKELSAL